MMPLRFTCVVLFLAATAVPGQTWYEDTRGGFTVHYVARRAVSIDDLLQGLDPFSIPTLIFLQEKFSCRPI